MVNYKKYIILCFFVCISWTALVYSLYNDVLNIYKLNINDQALTEARIAFEKDIVYRRWAARFGGVYVEESESFSPNPYLDVPDRDIKTETGKKLTLINPAYMTRLVHGIMAEDAGLKGHITSLNPIRPGNAPDDWEKQALESFLQGTPEAYSLTQEDGRQVLRFMRPMITEKTCLKCHAKQGYKEGEIRGGISITVPMERYEKPLNDFIKSAKTQYSIIYSCGLLFTGFIFLILIRNEKAQLKITRDIHLAENALRDTEERNKAVLQTTMDGYWRISPQGKILEANPLYCSMSGYSESELLSMNVWDIDSAETNANILKHMDKVIEKGEDRFETQHRRKDGTIFDVEISVKYKPIEGGQFVAFLRDITDRKRSEEFMTASLKEKEVLLREIHHRVKNNLQIISSLLSLQEQGEANPDTLGVLAESRGRVTSIALIHEQIYRTRDLTGIAVGEYLRELLPKLVSTFKGYRDITLQIDVPAIRLTLDQAIPFGLVMNELATNSLKHAFKDRSKGFIHVSGSIDGDSASLLFEDDGLGLPENFNMETIVSLGLQIVTMLINQLHGTITVEQAQGARFRIRFPLQMI